MATQLYTPTEFAHVMRVTPQYVRKLCATGKLGAVRLKQGETAVWRIPFDMEEVDGIASRNKAFVLDARPDALSGYE